MRKVSDQRKRSSFYIKSEPLREETVSFGFRWLLENVREHGTGFVVSSTKSLGGMVSAILGEPAVRALENRRRMNFNRIFLKFFTADDLTRLDSSAEFSFVLVLCPDRNLLEVLDKFSAISSILVITDHYSEIRDWVSRWGARNLGATSRPAR